MTILKGIFAFLTIIFFGCVCFYQVVGIPRVTALILFVIFLLLFIIFGLLENDNKKK